MAKMTAPVVNDRLENAEVYPYKVFKSKGEFVARFGFFYRHGGTVEKKAAEIQEAIPEAHITEAEEYWNAWPKDSYWEVRFTL